MMKSLTEQLKSKKFRAMLIGIGILLASQLGVDEETAKQLIPMLAGVAVVVVAYIGGQGLADMGKAKAEIDLKAALELATKAGKQIAAAHADKPEAGKKEDAPK